MTTELAEILDDPMAVVAIEWAELVADVLPDERITITINATGEESRAMKFLYPEKFKQLGIKMNFVDDDIHIPAQES